MKDGRITQDGKYNDILKSGSDFMELVGAHKETLSALDSIEAGAVVVGEDSSTGNAKNFLQKKESPTDQNDKTDNAMGTNGHFGNRLSMLVYQAVGLSLSIKLLVYPAVVGLSSCCNGDKWTKQIILFKLNADEINMKRLNIQGFKNQTME
ncbi:Peptide exporter [Forsythia ovata]|uniref:Peptide exporter n=1 Tax=Forsythia ovata TaxID=205694 RepID=A0ABD1WNM3_9LAMI